MGAVERLDHRGVEGLRVGRFGSGPMTTCIVWRLGSTVIDCGPPNQWRTVRAFLAERPVSRLLVTHHHEDHGGNLGRAAAMLGVTAQAPRPSLRPLADGFPVRLYQRLIWGAPRPVAAEPIPAEIQLPEGGLLRPLATPGHAPDLTCYLEPERGLLFSGDLYLGRRLRYLRRGEDLAAMIVSLREVQRVDFETVLCAHRGVVERGKEALAAKLQALCDLCGAVQRELAAGRSRRAVRGHLLGAEGWVRCFTGGDVSSANLVDACAIVDPELLAGRLPSGGGAPDRFRPP